MKHLGAWMMLVGTRPEIIKMAPLMRAFKQRGMPFTLVHSGQHYDYNMSERFFEDLGLPHPDVNLRIRASAPAAQMAEVMAGFEGDLKGDKATARPCSR